MVLGVPHASFAGSRREALRDGSGHCQRNCRSMGCVMSARIDPTNAGATIFIDEVTLEGVSQQLGRIEAKK